MTNDQSKAQTCEQQDPLHLYGLTLHNRLLLGTAQYPSPKILLDSIASSATQMITVSLRREMALTQHQTNLKAKHHTKTDAQQHSGRAFWELIKTTNAYASPQPMLVLMPRLALGGQAVC